MVPATTPSDCASPLTSPDAKSDVGLISETSSLYILDPSTQHARKRLIIASCLCFFFFLVELIGGIVSGSVAILSDSFHLLSDLSGFLISLFSIYVAQQKATKRHSFGFHRAEILGALLSVFIIWVVTGFLLKEAIERVQNPKPINGPLMLGIATAGVFVNIFLIFALGHGHDHGHSHSHSHNHHHHGDHPHHHHDTHEPTPLEIEAPPENPPRTRHSSHGHSQNINLRAAIIHIVGDIVSSLGVLLASIVVTFKPEYVIIDPICTFFFSVIVLYTTYHLIRDSVYVLMEGTPSHIDPASVEADLLTVPNVLAVHDLHIWTLTVGKVALAVHLVVAEDASVDHYAMVLEQAQDMLCQEYHVHHTTIQVESDRSEPWGHCKSSLCNGGVCAGPLSTIVDTNGEGEV